MILFQLLYKSRLHNCFYNRVPQPVNSTIFKTIADDATKSGEAITFLGKKISDIKNDLKDHKGIINSLFNSEKNNLSDEQLNILNLWNKKVKDAQTTQEELNEVIANCDDTTKKYFNSLKGGKATVDGLGKATEGLSLKAKSGQVALKGLAAVGKTIGNMAVSAGIMLAINAIITGITDFVNSY